MNRQRILFALVGGIIIIAIGIVGYWAISPFTSPSWTGFVSSNSSGLTAKTLWDWLELLVVPGFLVISAWLLGALEKETERKTQEHRQNQETLEKYFDRMSELLIKEKMRDSSIESEVRSLARNWSLSVLRMLDGDRKADALQFMYESGNYSGPE